MLTRIKIALLLIVLAVIGWRPAQVQKAAAIRSVAAMFMNSVVAAQRDALLSQIEPAIIQGEAPRRCSKVGVRSGKATFHHNDAVIPVKS